MCVLSPAFMSHWIDIQSLSSRPLQFQLVCEGCPDHTKHGGEWKCRHCSYQHPDPVQDPFYQSTVKNLMYFCAVILLFVGSLALHDVCQGTIDAPDSPISSAFGSHSALTPRKFGRTPNSCCTLRSRVACLCTIRSPHHLISSLVYQSQGHATQTLLVPNRVRLPLLQMRLAQAPTAAHRYHNPSAQCLWNPPPTLPPQRHPLYASQIHP